MPKIQLKPLGGDVTEQPSVVEKKPEEVVLAKTPEELVALEEEIRQNDLRKETNLINITRKRQRTKRLTLAGVIVLSLALLGFGIYGTFFRQTMTDEDVRDVLYSTTLVNELYPDSAVEGYLRQNLDEIFTGYLNFSQGSGSKIEYVRALPNTLYVTRVNKRSVELSNVQFEVMIEVKEQDSIDGEGITTPGKIDSKYYNFLVPVRYDTSTRLFSLAGKPELSVNPVKGIPVEVNVSEFLSFNGIDEMDAARVASAKEFVDTFLRTLYNSNSSISTFTDSNRESFVIDGQTFVAITDFHIYTTDNPSGLNSFCDFTVSTDLGFTYNTRLYFKLENLSGGSWKINTIF